MIMVPLPEPTSFHSYPSVPIIDETNREVQHNRVSPDEMFVSDSEGSLLAPTGKAYWYRYDRASATLSSGSIHDSV